MKTALLHKFAIVFLFLLSTQCIYSQSTCTEDFTIRCPRQFQGCVDESPSSMNTGIPSVSSTIPLCDSVVFSYVDQPISMDDCNNNFNRVWTAEIPGVNPARKCSQRIELFDNTPPTIQSCPPDDILDAPNTAYNWMDPQVTDNCGTVNLTSNFTSGHVFPLGTTEVIYTATDGCGNTSTCYFFITVEDPCDDDFTLMCPDNYTDCRNGSTDPFDTGNANVTHSGDFCGTVTIDYQDIVNNETDCEYSITRTWTAIASETNESKTCTQTITLVDDANPVISDCPSDILLAFENRTYTWDVPTATDNCGPPTLNPSIANGSTFPVGSTTVTYTATDNCGNTSICSFIVTVEEECNTDFNISCPSNFNGCRNESTDPFDTGNANVTHSGDFCGTVTLEYNDQIISNTSCSYIVDRVWSATASESNETKSCTQRLTLEDTQAPVISNCPEDVILSYDDRTYTWVAPSSSDDCGSVTLSSSIANGSTFAEGTTTVTYTAIDECGNTSTCSFSVTVEQQCNTDFTIDCPSRYAGCRGDSSDPANTGMATVTHTGDFCGTISINYTDEIIRSNNCVMVIERTWSGTSSETSETKTCTQRIRLEDREDPSITACPNDVILEYEDRSYTWAPPTASDNCGTPTLESSMANGSTFPVGSTTVTYTASDECGNTSTCSFIVTVQPECNTDFSLSCPSSYNGCRNDSSDPYDTGNATVTHSGDFCGTISIDYQDNVVTNEDCSYIIDRVWTATSSETNETKSCTQRITLQDTQAPTLSNCPSNVTLEYADRTYTWNAPTATDDCSSTTLQSSVSNGSTFPVGTTTVTYTATDQCGNNSSCSFTITVKEEQCNTDFTLNCPSDYAACYDDNYTPASAGTATVSYSSDFCGNVSVNHTDHVVSNSACVKLIERTWKAESSESGEVKTCIQRISLEDNSPPSITNCPPNVTISMDNRTYTWAEPAASDDCGEVTLESSIPNGNTFPVGSTEVTYTAKDECGNVTICRFTVTVEEGGSGSSLLVNCPDDLLIDCNSQFNDEYWPLPEVSSTCNSCNSDYSNEFVDMGSIEGHRYLCSRYKATWEYAVEKARQMGGYLVVINDRHENYKLSNFLEVRSAWIGLSDYEREGIFEWVDGSEVTYSNWYPGQPNNYRNSQDHVELLNSGYWNDQYNYKELEFIVELPCILIEQIEGPSTPAHFTSNSTSIKYRITDGCGNTEVCSYDVIRSGGLTLNCPSDLDITLQDGQSSTVVEWDSPTFETCCNQSSNVVVEIPGYVYMGNKDGHRYYCSKDHLTWQQAQRACESHGGYLAVINNREENQMLAEFLTVQSAYIGLSDHQNEGHFSWVNGDPVTYSNWYPGQPNNYYNDQHYVELLHNGQWNDQYSHKRREYIMEIPGGVEIQQISGPVSGSSLSAGKYTVQYRANDACGNSSTCSIDISVNEGNESVACNTGPSDSREYWIESATFGSYKKVSGNNDGYANFTQSCIAVNKGDVMNIDLISGSSSYRNILYWAIFIDWNDDGNFSKEERIATGRSKHALKGRFLFSKSLPTGNFTLRIIVNTSGYPSTGCDAILFGEVEDYCLSVNESGYFNEVVFNKASFSTKEVILNAYEVLNEEEIHPNINEDIKISTLRVYPNPFSDIVNVAGEQVEKINIWSSNGSLIKSVIFKNSVIDLSILNPGVFILESIHTNGESSFEKIIKQ